MFEKLKKRRTNFEEPNVIKLWDKVEDAAGELETNIVELHDAHLQRMELDVSSLDPDELRASHLADIIERYEGWANDGRKEYDELMVKLDEKGIKWKKQLEANRLR